VLIGFDIDCCSVGFDGTHVYAIPRSRRALNYSVNIVDMSRRSYTYETRLIKYAQRKFAIAVPGLPFDSLFHPNNDNQCDHIDIDRLKSVQPEQCQGLVKILSAYIHCLLKTKHHSHYVIKAERIRRGEMNEHPQQNRNRRGFLETDYGWSPLWDTHLTGTKLAP
jgi:hypothetical protein